MNISIQSPRAPEHRRSYSTWGGGIDQEKLHCRRKRTPGGASTGSGFVDKRTAGLKASVFRGWKSRTNFPHEQRYIKLAGPSPPNVFTSEPRGRFIMSSSTLAQLLHELTQAHAAQQATRAGGDNDVLQFAADWFQDKLRHEVSLWGAPIGWFGLFFPVVETGLVRVLSPAFGLWARVEKGERRGQIEVSGLKGAIEGHVMPNQGLQVESSWPARKGTLARAEAPPIQGK